MGWVLMSEREVHRIEVLSGVVAGRMSTSEAAAVLCLSDRQVQRLLKTFREDGAVALRRDGTLSMRPSVKVAQSEIAGSVGAGDAFYAGVLFGLHEDWPLQRCLDLGNAAAATSLHSPTTSASIRPWADCLAYAESRGLRPGP